MASYKITISQSSWTATTAALWWDTVSQQLYTDSDLLYPCASIEIPTRELWRYNGAFSASSAGTQYIDADGAFTAAFFDMLSTATAAKTIYTQGTQVSYKLTISDNSGAGGVGQLYYKIDGGGFYADYLCEGAAVRQVTQPTRASYVFEGYYNGTSTLGNQYFDKSGAATANLDALALTAAKTIYARWVEPYKITVSANSGTGGTTAFYFDSVWARWFDTATMDNQITGIDLHTRECYATLGYWNTDATTGYKRVNEDGTFADGWLPTAAATIYAQWEQVSWKYTVGVNNGTGGTAAIYYGIDDAAWFADDLCTQPLVSITLPTRANYKCKGLYSTTSSTVQYFDKYGVPTASLYALTPTKAATIYAQWSALYTITLNANGGTGVDAIYYSVLDTAFYADALCANVVTAINIPVRECYRNTGYWNTTSGTTQYIDASGNILSTFVPTKALTIYAQWDLVSYKLTLDTNGGTGGTQAVYNDGVSDVWYDDYWLTVVRTGVAMPTRDGYAAMGYYATKSGGSRYIDNAGGFIIGAITADLTVHLRWSASVYTLTFDYNGATGTTVSKQVTMGMAVGALPAPTKDSAAFSAWRVNGLVITSSTIWNLAQDATAVAEWQPYFGNTIDYFSLGSTTLIPISSNSGDGCQRTCVANATWSTGSTPAQTGGAGRYSSGVSEASIAWRNPSVTYEVVGDMTFACNLGKAFAGTTTNTGYMITGVEVKTQIGKFPQITVKGTANEGNDAINLFAVSIPLLARARAQNLLGVVSGGGQLQEMSVQASCTPVICTENQVPCASDVVQGVLIASATTYAPTNEAAPTVTTASGFTAIGVPKECGDKSYMAWKLDARKEIV